MKKAAIALVVLVVGLAAGAAALLMRGGISARVEPTSIEVAVARRLRRLGIDSSMRTLQNPFPGSREVIHAGLAHFADHCAICHANDGSGKTEMGRNLYPRAPDLRRQLPPIARKFSMACAQYELTPCSFAQHGECRCSLAAKPRSKFS